jgi:hypothetical protein
MSLDDFPQLSLRVGERQIAGLTLSLGQRLGGRRPINGTVIGLDVTASRELFRKALPESPLGLGDVGRRVLRGPALHQGVLAALRHAPARRRSPEAKLGRPDTGATAAGSSRPAVRLIDLAHPPLGVAPCFVGATW